MGNKSSKSKQRPKEEKKKKKNSSQKVTVTNGAAVDQDKNSHNTVGATGQDDKGRGNIFRNICMLKKL